MAASYQKRDQGETQAPRCPECGASSWAATRPKRAARARNPHERKSPLERAVAVFLACFAGVVAMGLVVVMGFEILPGWVLAALCAGAAALMLTALVLIDGVASEAKSCALSCADCGGFFVVPWRHGV